METRLDAYKVPPVELQRRMSRFMELMHEQCGGWGAAIIFSKVNLLYFTGTMPEGMLLIREGGDATLWVRRDFERSLEESCFPDIKPMESFRDVAAAYPPFNGSVYLETEVVPLAMYQRLSKYFTFSGFKSLDTQVGLARSVKSAWELGFMKKSGEIHRRVMEEIAPLLFSEGMSEVELAGNLYNVMLREGHMGTARFGMFDTEMIVGQLGFGVSSLYPTSFNGPGGNRGAYPAMPGLGSREVRLRAGQLVFIDMAMAVNGYHTDKTMTYIFKGELPPHAREAHEQCARIQHLIAGMLKPGNIPSEIYESVMNSLDPGFLVNFMGFGRRQVKFLGHATGLTVDEIPVLAKGFNSPLEENMVFAVEPKKGVEDIGMVGIEDTFIVTPAGGISITGNHPGLLDV